MDHQALRDENHRLTLQAAREHIRQANETMSRQAIRDPVYVPVDVVVRLVKIVEELQEEIGKF